MVTLLEIQELVDKAQRKIEEGDSESVETVLWPDIKNKLGQCTELEWSYREPMKRIIFKRLNEQKLHTTPRPIQLEKYKRDLKEGKVKESEHSEIPSWIPW
jgi:hypothetical protein